MPYHPPDHLTVDELVLRWAVLDDAELIASAVAESLDHLGAWMPWATPEAAEVEEQRRRRAETAAETDAGTTYQYLLLVEQRLVGVVGLHRRIGPGAIEIGYWLTPQSVGKGYVTRAVRVLTEQALALPDVQRVEIRCDQANLRSQAVPRRLGFELARVEDDEVQTPNEVGRSMIWVHSG